MLFLHILSSVTYVFFSSSTFTWFVFTFSRESDIRPVMIKKKGKFLLSTWWFHCCWCCVCVMDARISACPFYNKCPISEKKKFFFSFFFPPLCLKQISGIFFRDGGSVHNITYTHTHTDARRLRRAKCKLFNFFFKRFKSFI